MNKHIAKVENLVLETLMQRGYSQGEAELIVSKLGKAKPQQPYDGIGTVDPNINDFAAKRKIINFGKYRGRELQDIDTNYLLWLQNQDWAQSKFTDLIRDIHDVLRARGVTI